MPPLLRSMTRAGLLLPRRGAPPGRRALAILPQPPLFSREDHERALELQRKAERTALNMTQQVAKAFEAPPRFRDMGHLRDVLSYY